MAYRALSSFRPLLTLLLVSFLVNGCDIFEPKPMSPAIYVDSVNGVDEGTVQSSDSSNQETSQRGSSKTPYKTIRFAYDDNPKHNGWVILKEGVYSRDSGETFPIRLPKGALLKSSGEATIRGNGAVFFASQNILSAFAITQSATIRDIIVKPENETAFVINHSSGDVELDRVTINTCKNGVLVNTSNSFIADYLVVRECSGVGLEARGGANIRIDNSSFIGNGIGLSILEQVSFDELISSYNTNNNFKTNVYCDVLINTTGTFDLINNHWDVKDDQPAIDTLCENGADLVVTGGADVVLHTPPKLNAIYIRPGAVPNEFSSLYTPGSKNAPYGSITKALSEKPDFTGVFILEPGTYSTNTGESFPIEIPDNAHLIGENGVLIQGAGNYPQNLLASEKVTLAITKNATVSNIKIDSLRNTAILVNAAAANIDFDSIEIENCDYGIKSIGNGNLNLEKLKVKDCLSEGISIGGTGEFLLRDSTLFNNTIGLSATESAIPIAENAIRNNTFFNNLNCDVLLTSQNTFNLLDNIWGNSVPDYVTANSCSNINTNIAASSGTTVVYLTTSDIDTVYVDTMTGNDTPMTNTNDIYQGDQAHPFKTISGVFNRYPEFRGTISLRPGNYTPDTGEQFPLRIPDGVNVVANTGATIRGNGNFETVGLAARSVTFVLQGESTLRNLSVDPVNTDGVLIINNAGNVKLDNVTIKNCFNGVYSAFSSNVNLTALSVTGCSGTAVEISGNSVLSLRNSELTGNAVGLIFSQSASLDKDSSNTSNQFKGNSSCDVKIEAEGEFKLYGNSWDHPESEIMASTVCGNGNDLVVAENSRVNIQQTTFNIPLFNSDKFIYRNTPTDGALYKESELQFSWSNYQSNIQAVAIWDDYPRFTKNGVANIENVVWYWHSGMNGNPSRVLYESGIRPQNGSVQSSTPPTPLTPGKTYYWAVWGWNDSGSRISEASDIGYFVSDPY